MSMACAQVSGYGDDIEELVSFGSAERPRVKKGYLLVRVQAVSLAPGDCRVMSGKTRLVQGPPSLPYIPGGDVCGEVLEVHEAETQFKVGDVVVGMFDTTGPRGALAEYKLVKASHAALKPHSITAQEACALPSSALSAMLLCEQYLQKDDRVLVLGGSGGVGCHLLQMLKPKASYVAATSTQGDLLKGLGADKVVDYRSEHWWEVAEFRAAPFDLVIDLWGTREPWEHAKSSGVVKSSRQGGRYVTLVGDTPYMVFQHWWHIFPLLYDMQAHGWHSWMWRSEPKWVYHLGLEPTNNLQRLLAMAARGELKVVLDSVHNFDAEGVMKAFHVQKSRHAHGKVVVNVSS